VQKFDDECGFCICPLFPWSMLFWIWWFLNFHLFGPSKNMNWPSFLTLTIHDQRFLLCKLVGRLQWVGPLWVNQGSIPHYSFVKKKVGTKKLILQPKKYWKKIESLYPQSFTKKPSYTKSYVNNIFAIQSLKTNIVQ
jgi:hypothetical protein